MSEVASTGAAPAEVVTQKADTSAEVADNYEVQADGTAEGERGELLPEEAVAVQEEQRRAMLGKKKIPLKVNGRDIDYEIDLDNEAELAKHLQKAMAADEKFQEAAMTRKQMQQFVQALKADPLAILAHPELGINVKELAERVINQELEDLQKSPEQKRLEQLERDLKDRDAKLKEVEEAKRAAEMARLEEQAFQELDRDIDEALKSSNLPKSPYTMRRLADLLISANELGYTEARVKDVMPYLEQTMEAELQEMFGRMPEEVIERLIGQNLERVRKSKISKVKQVAKTVTETAAAQAPKKEEPKKEKVHFKKFFNQWE